MLMPNVAVLGCGYWGKNLVRNFFELGALGLVCDPLESGRAVASKIAPGIPVSARFEDALANLEITAVAISAPAAMHYALAKQALDAGKDVFVEKPLCLHVNEAEELVAIASAKKKVLMVGHLLQYHPCVQALHAMVGRGELGKVHYIVSNRLNLGKIRREENALWSFAPHDISVILSLANAQMPESVRCIGGEYLNQGVADTTLTSLKFSTGARAHVFVSWLNPFKEQKLTVIGSNGMAVFDDTKPWNEKLTVFKEHLTWEGGEIPTANKSVGQAIVVPESEPLRNECGHFLDCCAKRQHPRTDGNEGLRVLSVLQAAQASLEKDGEGVSPAKASRPSSGAFIHPTAVAGDGSSIGEGTKVWHFSHIMKGAKVGERCVIGQNVNIDSGAVIGNNVKIQNNVSVYSGVTVEDDVFLGPSCVLTNVSNPRSQVSRRSLYEKTLLKRGCSIGANATIVCGVTIGKYAFIAAGSVVTKNVPDYALVLGNPGRQVGWISRHGHKLLESDDKTGVMKCPESGYRYCLNNGVLRCLDLDEDEPLPENLSKGVKSYREFKGGLRS